VPPLLLCVCYPDSTTLDGWYLEIGPSDRVPSYVTHLLAHPPPEVVGKKGYGGGGSGPV